MNDRITTTRAPRNALWTPGAVAMIVVISAIFIPLGVALTRLALLIGV